jgi:formylglycine-generating enzyme required for sulfatase activity
MFFRGYDVGTDNANTNMTHPATVSDFQLDTYEVTVGRFRRFVNAGMGTQANPPPSGAGARTLSGMAGQGGWDPTWNGSLPPNAATLLGDLNCGGPFQSWTNAPGANEALPMNCISWFEAFAFCVWDGGFLPTDSEWNYAAAGGGEQRAYPWSNPPSSLTIDCSYANHFYNGTTSCAPLGAFNRVGSESPKGDGKYGQADLTGNAWEWTLDWYQNPYGDPCDNCANLTVATNRVEHGGSSMNSGSALRGAYRNQHAPNYRAGYDGVRCARSAN